MLKVTTKTHLWSKILHLSSLVWQHNPLAPSLHFFLCHRLTVFCSFYFFLLIAFSFASIYMYLLIFLLNLNYCIVQSSKLQQFLAEVHKLLYMHVLLYVQETKRWCNPLSYSCMALYVHVYIREPGDEANVYMYVYLVADSPQANVVYHSK